jgi:predicted Zn-ribbon and HTH transcriptional regulator
MVFLRKAGSARRETVRQRIITLLEDQGPGDHGPGGRPLSALEISGYVGVAEKEVYEHLVHIQRSVNKAEIDSKQYPLNAGNAALYSEKGRGLKSPAGVPCAGVNRYRNRYFQSLKNGRLPMPSMLY